MVGPCGYRYGAGHCETHEPELQYGAKSIGTWSVRIHCIQPTTIHTEIFKRSDWLMSTDPVPILLAPYCRILPHFSHDALRPQIQTPLEFMFL